MVFDGSASRECTLNTNLAGVLDGFSIKSGYLNQVTLNGNATTTGGFELAAGTLSVSANKTFTIGTRTGAFGNLWSGGSLVGAGTVYIDGASVYAFSAASSLGANLTIGSSGLFDLGSLTGNLALTGDSNDITIQSGGKLLLTRNVAPADANTKGGITGSNSHTIWAYGDIVRGSADYSVGGTVKIEVPVCLDGGNFTVYWGDSTSVSQDVVNLTGADSNLGYSLIDSWTGSTIHLDADTKLIVANGLYMDAQNAKLEMQVTSLLSSIVQGNVYFASNGGTLSILDDVAGTTGTAQINGNLTLSSNTVVSMNWNGNNIDKLSVTGTATLGGTLRFSGDTPPTLNTWITVIDAGTIASNFSTFEWSGHAATTFENRTQNGGNGTLYQIRVTALPPGAGEA